MFSKATEYALRATIYIAQKSAEDNKLGIDEIAIAIDSPKSFTAKILQSLTKDNKIISSTRGPNGGFFISDKARKLPAKCILEAMGEEDLLEKCVMGLKQCDEAQPCPMHAQYKGIIRVKSFPKQINSYDCGIYCLLASEALLLNLKNLKTDELNQLFKEINSTSATLKR